MNRNKERTVKNYPSYHDDVAATQLCDKLRNLKLSQLRIYENIYINIKKEKSEKIRKAGEKYPGYEPSVSDIKEAADLVSTGYLTKLKYLWLFNLDLSPSDEAAVKSLLSVCTDCVDIYNVRGCDLIIKHVNSKKLWISYQTLSASETADLVTCMRDRVERVVLGSDVTLDVKTLDTRIGELRQGTCRQIKCWDDTRDKYREHLTKWANTLGWRTMETGDSFHIYR